MNDTNQPNKNAGGSSAKGDDTALPRRGPDDHSEFAREVDLASKRATTNPDDASDEPGFGFAPEIQLAAKREMPRPRRQADDESYRLLAQSIASAPAVQPDSMGGPLSSTPVAGRRGRFAAIGLAATFAVSCLVSGTMVWSAYQDPSPAPIAEKTPVETRAIEATLLNGADQQASSEEQDITEAKASAAPRLAEMDFSQTYPSDVIAATSALAPIPVEPSRPVVDITERPPADDDLKPPAVIAALYPSPDLLNGIASQRPVEPDDPVGKGSEAIGTAPDTPTPAAIGSEAPATGAGLASLSIEPSADGQAEAVDEPQEPAADSGKGGDEPGVERSLVAAAGSAPKAVQRSGISRLQRLAALGVVGSGVDRVPELKPLHMAATVDTPARRILPPKPELKPLKLAAAINSAFIPAFKPKDATLAADRSRSSGAAQRPSVFARFWNGLVGGLRNLVEQGEGRTSPVLLAADRRDKDDSNSGRAGSSNDNSGNSGDGGNGGNSGGSNASGGDGGKGDDSQGGTNGGSSGGDGGKGQDSDRGGNSGQGGKDNGGSNGKSGNSGKGGDKDKGGGKGKGGGNSGKGGKGGDDD